MRDPPSVTCRDGLWLGAIALALAAPELASDPSSLSAADGIFDALQRDMLVLKNRLALMLSAVPNLPEIGPFLLQRLTKQHDPEHIWILAFNWRRSFAGAVFGEAVARRMFRPLLRFLPAIDVRTEFGRLGALLVTAVIRFFELSAFLLVAVGLFFAIYDGHQAARYAFWCVLFIILLVRLVAVGLRVLLAPSLPDLRLPALDDRSARRLFRSLVSVAALVIGAGLVSTLLHDIGLPEPLHLAASFVLMVAATCGLIAVIWGERRAITQLIGGRPADHAQRNDLAGLFAANWHVFATCIVLAIAIAAFCERLVTGERQATQSFGTLGVLLGLLLIDGLLRMAVRSYFGAETTADRLAEAGGPETPADEPAAPRPLFRTAMSCQRCLWRRHPSQLPPRARGSSRRAGGRLWGFDAAEFGSTGLGARVAEAVFQIIVTLMLASAGLERRQNRDQSSPPAREAGRA